MMTGISVYKDVLFIFCLSSYKQKLQLARIAISTTLTSMYGEVRDLLPSTLFLFSSFIKSII